MMLLMYAFFPLRPVTSCLLGANSLLNILLSIDSQFIVLCYQTTRRNYV